MSDHDCEAIARRVAKEEINLFRNALIQSFDDDLTKLKKELGGLRSSRNSFVGGFTKDISSSDIFTQNEVKIKDLEIKISAIESVKKDIADSSKYYS